MGLWSRLFGRPRRAMTQMAPAIELADLPLRRDVADRARLERRTEAIGMLMPGGQLDAELAGFRRLTGGDARQTYRDLTPMEQDRMLEMVWFLYEQNPLARRLITLMTDLVVGDGFSVEAKDPRIQEAIDAVWRGGANPLTLQVRQIHDSWSLNGELIIPVAINEVTGKPTFGFIDPYVVKTIRPLPGNVLIADVIQLKDTGTTAAAPLRVVREQPDGLLLVGDAFYSRINGLPNSTRGRSDLLPYADWCDIYDQFVFAEAQRARLLSTFVWDLSVKGGDEKAVQAERAKFPANPAAGTVFAHNENTELNARTPDLQAQDRGEVARLLRMQIAGTYGYPEAWMGDASGTNRASIEGQNDIMLKTPSARQRAFSAVIQQYIRFTIEQATTKNPALYAGADTTFKLRLPEIAAKDVARAGSAIAGVAAAMDTGLANGTVSKRLATTATLAMLRQLGIDEDPQAVIEEINTDQDANAIMRDEMQRAATQKRATATPAA